MWISQTPSPSLSLILSLSFSLFRPHSLFPHHLIDANSHRDTHKKYTRIRRSYFLFFHLSNVNPRTNIHWGKNGGREERTEEERKERRKRGKNGRREERMEEERKEWRKRGSGNQIICIEILFLFFLLPPRFFHLSILSRSENLSRKWERRKKEGKGAKKEIFPPFINHNQITRWLIHSPGVDMERDWVQVLLESVTSHQISLLPDSFLLFLSDSFLLFLSDSLLHFLYDFFFFLSVFSFSLFLPLLLSLSWISFPGNERFQVSEQTRRSRMNIHVKKSSYQELTWVRFIGRKTSWWREREREEKGERGRGKNWNEENVQNENFSILSKACPIIEKYPQKERYLHWKMKLSRLDSLKREFLPKLLNFLPKLPILD